MNKAKNRTIKSANSALPEIFKPILWSYDFSKVDAIENKKTIIINAINYGDLRHWRWIKEKYGLLEIKNILKNAAASEFRAPALKLALILFSAKNNYARRIVNQSR